MDGHTHQGKWSQPGVPHKGWVCTGGDDLGSPSHICEMCESVEVRYVHFMEHPDYPEELKVGCVCAENMEQDRIAPRLREKAMKSRTRRRATWNRREWRLSQSGNEYLNVDGYRVVVFPGPSRSDPWKIRITHRETDRSELSRRRYDTCEMAKRASFEALEWAKDYMT